MPEKNKKRASERNLTKKLKDLISLLDVTRLLSSDMSLPNILQTMFQTTNHIMNCDRYSLFIYDEEKDELYSRIALGSEAEEIRFQADKGIAGNVFKTGKLINLKDCYADPRFNREVDLKTGYRTKSLLCVPVTSFDGKRIGVIQLLNKRRGVFTPYDEYLLNLLASHLGVAVQRAILMENYLEKQKLESEMNIAYKIQASLTPDGAPVYSGLDIACFSKQCESTGGDYLDFVVVDESKLGIVIGDVTGHGLGASLLMLVARSTFRVLIEDIHDMPELAARMNNRIVQDFSQGRSMTLFFGILNNQNNTLKYVNCGHDDPLWYHAEDGTVSYLAQSGLSLGMLPGVVYKEGEECKLKQNDILVFYTDGITEAMNREKELFGNARLEAVIKKHAAGNSAAIQKQVRRSIADFLQQEKQQDDMTMIVIKATGRE
ncbi:MAG: SpoIIE family protein phosphatase [Spirochaetales bacterium]|nr:SpoIIE family protein phosphatase [Spirochaetales bacterium]